MASAKYTTVSNADSDEESQRDSSSFLYNHLSKQPKPYVKILSWLRLVVEACLTIAIILLLVALSRESAGHVSNRFEMPSFPMHSVLFQGQERYSSIPSFSSKEALHETLKHWSDLSPNARGTVYVDPGQRQGLPTPYNITKDLLKHNTTGPSEVYMVSVFHQLHCLSSLMQAFGLLYIEDKKPDVFHVAHCFDYLRQGVMCAGDTTLEGQTKYGEGWGSVHQCKDLEAIKAWAQENGAIPIGDFIDTL